jgi:copper homeostasis protein
MALLEVCCGSPESVAAAVAGGARRIELCAHLELDGLTPPMEWVRDAKTRYPDLLVHVLIRPRAGDFVYAAEETDTMVLQIREALEAGADGIVIGALTPAGDVDLALLKRLISVIPAGRASVTFHRAFDVCRKPFDALEQIIGLGCNRILTSGQQPTVVEGTDMLRALRQHARGRILILPGGGVTPENAARVLAGTGCVEIHASASETIDGKKITSAAKVAAILQAISAC